MKKNLILLLLFFPALLFAQRVQEKDGTISIGLGKKNKQKQDTIQEQPVKEEVPEQEEEKAQEEEGVKEGEHPEKIEKIKVAGSEFNQHGIFKGLFHVGMNASKIDGDRTSGYQYLGFQGGIGAMIRIHNNFAISMEMNYSMKGDKFRNTQNPRLPQKHVVALDYIEIPVSLNVNSKKLILFSIGMAPAVLVRYKETFSTGNISNSTSYGLSDKFDLSAFAGFYFSIKHHFLVGGKFSYSLIKLNSSFPGSRGLHNNVITFRFMYILDNSSSKKKK